MPQALWCDENGFTGNRLLDKDQSTFVYASVAIGDLEAGELVARIVKDAAVQGELKAAKLLRFNSGRKAIERLVNDLDGRFLLTIYDKKFALACKFFEYIFEPALAANNYFFYRIRFHKFIANLLYVHFAARKQTAEEIFQEFESAMRELDESRLHRLLLQGEAAGDRGLQPIVEFGVLNFGAVKKEIESLRGNGVGKWVLDVTTSALYSHLSFWGDRFDALEVYCDSSKPIFDTFPVDVFVGKTEKVYTDISGEAHLLTPNLSKPIELLDSRAHPGLQIADVLAGTGLTVFNRRDSELERIGPAIVRGFSGDSVLPEPDEYLSSSAAAAHVRVLDELIRRSRAGESIVDRIEKFIG